jgi:hypothetical protein
MAVATMAALPIKIYLLFAVGVIRGESSMAPMTTGVELVSRPYVAMITARLSSIEKRIIRSWSPEAP